jgi:ATP-dependent Clp protease ATP-binding subunit ClpA
MTAAEALPPEDGLRTVAALRLHLEALEALHVEKAVRAGWSWRRIADVMGVTKQAVHKKHARRLSEKLAAETAEPTRLIVTGEARRSVRLAREEAAALGAAHVRPDHLLLGLLRGTGPSAAALADAGIVLERARAAAAMLPTGARDGPTGPPRERLPVAPDARAVLEDSRRRAVARGDGHVGVEHLLLAVLREKGRGAALLAALGVEPETLARLVDERLATPV